MKLSKKLIISITVLILFLLAYIIIKEQIRVNKVRSNCENSIIYKVEDMVVVSGFDEKLKIKYVHCSSDKLEPTYYVQDKSGALNTLNQSELELYEAEK